MAAPSDADALARIALALGARAELPGSTRYRLVGVGLSNVGEAGPQADLFDDASH